MDEPCDPTPRHLWEFVRGDLAASEFECWLQADPNIEGDLGSELYMEALSADLSDKDQLWSIRNALARHARSRPGPSCFCIRLRDVEVVDMGHYRAPTPAFEDDREWSGDVIFDTRVRVKDRGARYWWLYAARCRECSQGWLVVCEARINDVMCMRRLEAGELDAIVDEDRWPAEFESFECLLQMGHRAGRSVRWVDPMDSDLGETVTEIARAQPGVAVSEIAKLLSIESKVARKLARRAVKRSKVKITFDSV